MSDLSNQKSTNGKKMERGNRKEGSRLRKATPCQGGQRAEIRKERREDRGQRTED